MQFTTAHAGEEHRSSILFIAPVTGALPCSKLVINPAECIGKSDVAIDGIVISTTCEPSTFLK
jgi:hypothetical protein